MGESSKEKSDHWFLAASWKDLITREPVASAKTINVWSDGAGQHFKSTPTITFFSQFQEVTTKQVFVNYFVSYHGHSGCDTKASHAKAKLNQHTRDTHQIINTPYAVIKKLAEIPKTTAIIAATERPNKKTKKIFKTYQGIKTAHFFMFYNKYIYALNHTPEITEQIINKAKEDIASIKEDEHKNRKNREFHVWVRRRKHDFFEGKKKTNIVPS